MQKHIGKIILALFLLILLTFVGGVTYLYMKITPERVKGMVVKLVEEELPGSMLEIEQVELSLGFYSEVRLEGIRLVERENQSNVLMTINSIKKAVTIESLLRQKVDIKTEVEVIRINYGDIITNKGHWQSILPQKEALPKTEAKTVKEEKKKEWGDIKKEFSQKRFWKFFLRNLNFSLYLNDIKVAVKLKDLTNGNIRVDSLNVVNLGFTNPLTVDLDIWARIMAQEKEEFIFHILSNSNINLNEIVKGKQVKIFNNITLDGMSYSGIKNKIPNFEISLLINEQEDDELNMILSMIKRDERQLMDEIFHLSSRFNFSGDKIQLKDLDSELKVTEFLKIFTPQKQLEAIKGSDCVVNFGGDLIIDKNGEIIPDLTFMTKGALNIELPQTKVTNGRLDIKFVDKKFGARFFANMLDGAMAFNIGGQWRNLNTKMSLDQLENIELKLQMKDIKYQVGKEKKEKEKKSSMAVKRIKKKGAIKKKSKSKKDSTIKRLIAKLPKKMNVDVDVDNLVIEGRPISLQGKIIKNNNFLKCDGINLQMSEGKGTVAFSTLLNKNYQTEAKIDFDVNNLNFDSIRPFFPDEYKSLMGEFLVKVHGDLKTEGDLKNMILNLNFLIKNNLKSRRINIHKMAVIQQAVDGFKELRFKAKSTSKGIELKDIKSKVALVDILTGMTPENVKIRNRRLDFQFEGDVIYTHAKKIIPNLSFKLSEELRYLWDGNHISSNFKGDINVQDVKLKGVHKLLNGNVYFDGKTKFDVNQKNIILEKLSPIYILLIADGLKMPKERIRKLLYSKEIKGNKGKEIKDIKTKPGRKEAKSAPMAFPHVVLNYRWKNVKVGKQASTGSGKIETKGNKIWSDKMRFTFSKGKCTGKIATFFKENDAIDTRVDVKMNKLNLDSLNLLLPNNIRELKGTFSGDISGNVLFGQTPPMVKHNINIKALVEDGEVIDIQIFKGINKLLTSIPALGSLLKSRKFIITNKFRKLELAGVLKHNHYQLKKVNFFGRNPRVEMKSHGDIYPLKDGKESELLMELEPKTSRISEYFIRHLGRTDIPIRMTGEQFDLAPDYNYTMKKIGKSALKTKAAEKVKRKGKKELKKIGKKIFKGIFK